MLNLNSTIINKISWHHTRTHLVFAIGKTKKKRKKATTTKWRRQHWCKIANTQTVPDSTSWKEISPIKCDLAKCHWFTCERASERMKQRASVCVCMSNEISIASKFITQIEPTHLNIWFLHSILLCLTSLPIDSISFPFHQFGLTYYRAKNVRKKARAITITDDTWMRWTRPAFAATATPITIIVK